MIILREKKFSKKKIIDWLSGDTSADRERVSRRVSRGMKRLADNGKLESNPQLKKLQELTETVRAEGVNRVGKAAMIAAPILLATGLVAAKKLR